MAKKILALLLAVTLFGGALASCGNEQGGNDDSTPEVTATVSDLKTAVKGAYGSLYDPESPEGMPLMEIPADILDATFGIKAEWVDEYAAEMPMMMTNVDTYVIVKPTEGNGENVLNALNSYYDYLVNDAMHYPKDIEKVRAAKVFEKNGFVFFIMLGILSDDVLFNDQGTEEEIAAAQYNEAVANNQKAIDAIDALLGK